MRSWITQRQKGQVLTALEQASGVRGGGGLGVVFRLGVASENTREEWLLFLCFGGF